MIKIKIKPGMVVPSNGVGNQWAFTVIHPTFGEKTHAKTFATKVEAKTAMQTFVANFNNAS